MNKLIIGPNVLLVEDDESYGKALGRLLSGDCPVIEQVQSCEEALQTISGRESYFDVIILDQGLAGKSSGLECLRAIKNAGLKSEVIFLTGMGSRALGVEALREGAFRYFTKQSENDEELVCSLLVAHDLVRAKKINQNWKDTGKSMNASLVMIIVVAILAMFSVVVMNVFAPDNFMLSTIFVCAFLLILFFGASGVNKFKMTWKEGGKSGELSVDGTASKDHREV